MNIQDRQKQQESFSTGSTASQIMVRRLLLQKTKIYNIKSPHFVEYKTHGAIYLPFSGR